VRAVGPPRGKVATLLVIAHDGILSIREAALEFSYTLADRGAHLRQPLCAKEKQDHHYDKQDFPHAEVSHKPPSKSERAIKYATRTPTRLRIDTWSPIGPKVKSSTRRSIETGPNRGVQVLVRKVRAALSGSVCRKSELKAPPTMNPTINTPM
jgi:hypothetical protein